MLSRVLDGACGRLDGAPRFGQRSFLRQFEDVQTPAFVLLAGSQPELSSSRLRTTNMKEGDGPDFDDFSPVWKSTDWICVFDQQKSSFAFSLKIDFSDEAVKYSKTLWISGIGKFPPWNRVDKVNTKYIDRIRDNVKTTQVYFYTVCRWRIIVGLLFVVTKVLFHRRHSIGFRFQSKRYTFFIKIEFINWKTT